MLRLRAAILTSLGLFLVGVLSSAAEPDLSQEELSATYESSDIDDAIEKSIQYLLTAQEQDGAFRQKPRERRNEAAMTSLAMLALCLLRVPIMYEHVGGSTIDIGGILVTPPQSPDQMHKLMRADNNRYLIVLAPFLVLGLREGFGRIGHWWVSHMKKEKS